MTSGNLKIFSADCLAPGHLWLEVFAVLWVYTLPTAACFKLLGMLPAATFAIFAVLPHLLWRPTSSTASSSFILANALHWNAVYPLFFGSPLFICIFCWAWPWSFGLAVLLYAVAVKLFLRPDLKDGASWPTFSKYDWGIRALRCYLNLRLHIHEKLLVRPAAQPVIVAIHPHGIASDYRVALDGLLYAALPGRRVLALGASVLFSLPFVRELCLWTRVIDARRSVAARALRKGHSLLVIPGGEAEQMRTQPGVEEVYLKRTGFVRLAMTHGAALVPCYAFGAVDLYDVSPSQHKSNARGLRWALSKKCGVAIPSYRGVFGFLPKRVPNDLVFGEPFEASCAKPGEPTDDEVRAAHAAYIGRLRNLFDTHKAEFGFAGRSLVVVAPDA